MKRTLLAVGFAIIVSLLFVPTGGSIDIALSVNSGLLFVLVGGTQSVASFRVGPNGGLTPVNSAGGLPLGAQGIAAK